MAPVESSDIDKAFLSGLVDASALVSVLNYFYPVQPGVEDFLNRNLLALSVPRKKIILKEGDLCEHVYFIGKGAVRGFMREGRTDITTWITVENEMVTSIASLNEKAPAPEFMQAVEDCELLALSFEQLERLYEQFPDFNITIRKLLQRYYWDAERRAYIARLTKAESKYKHFLDHHQHLANRIPLKYIASYLGMTMETLSRVRKKMAEK